LTLILGCNGAGKTTIIESLRTMTAGSMPPNTHNGKTFLHDPRISNVAETKAFLKLKFTTTSGKEVFALRSFQLMNKKTKQEFKKLEQVLKAKDDKGNDISINKNCMEMDR
jgi:DNA repair protein RAD50